MINLFRTANEKGLGVIHTALMHTKGSSWLSSLLQFVALESENNLDRSDDYDLALRQFENFSRHIESVQANQLVSRIEKHWDDIRIKQVERMEYRSDRDKLEELNYFTRELVQRLVADLSDKLQGDFSENLSDTIGTLFFPKKITFPNEGESESC